MLNPFRKNPMKYRLECVWLPTGNPRQPLACVWMENEAVLLEHTPHISLEPEVEEERR